MPSTRAEVITRRTYNRPLDLQGTTFETWEQTVDRVIDRQEWLWHRADPTAVTSWELDALKQLILDRKVSVSGRTLWLGGTEIAKHREASQFNCSFLKVETVNDVVDAFWLLLQGCGVGFTPVVGTLFGFVDRIPDIEIRRSTRTEKGGEELNVETWDSETKTWTIKVGDSAEAWAKSIGKIVAGKYPASRLVLDFSEVRPAGGRLSGYGWICSGDGPLARAYTEICRLLNRRAGQTLHALDIMDLLNWLGTVLSTRRSSQICILEYRHPEWKDFALAKQDLQAEPQRVQSNNSILFNSKPDKDDLEFLFKLMQKSGGCEPGIINGQTARERAPWFAGVNPCAEITLGNKSFCNLTEVNVAAFKDDYAGLERAVWLVARANYRQTLVDLRDGILQETWHQNNEFLRLCGVGLTGIIRRPDLSAYDYKRLRNVAVMGAYSMADELGTQRSKNCTTVKPSGTLSKIMDTTEGCHRPLGKYMLNWIVFSKDDPLCPKLKAANYRIIPHPFSESDVVVAFPVKWDDVQFDEVDGLEVNLEPALDQLKRYKMLMDNWAEQNVSITVYYSEDEIEPIIEWLDNHWEDYVGVSFMPRIDPTVSAADLGFSYLPQEVLPKDKWEAYVNTLGDINFTKSESFLGLDVEECAGGACPVR